MPTFLKVALIGIGVFFVVSRLPLPFISSVICWVVITLAAYYYPKQIAEKVEQMSSPTGYAVGMGVLMGVAINTGGVLLNFIWDLCAASVAGVAAGASHNTDFASNAAAGATIAGLGALGNLFLLFGAPIWGAALGALGGLIGGSTMKRAAVLPPSGTQ